MLIAIDSSQSSGSIALGTPESIVYNSGFDLRITHSESLMPAIDQALGFCSLRRDDLQGIVLAVGPGSFTGLRIGLSTAKGIAYGLKIPIYCYDTLVLGAYPYKGLGRQILSVVDAKMSEFYAALYDPDLGVQSEPGICKKEDLQEWKLDNPILVGTGAMAVADYLKQQGIAFSMPPLAQGINTATVLLALHSRDDKPKAYDFEELALLEPLYLRESTAQIKRAKG